MYFVVADYVCMFNALVNLVKSVKKRIAGLILINIKLVVFSLRPDLD